jgi:Domain of unknown function (DUF4062)/AAA domain
MTPMPNSRFQAGGALPPDHPTYVEREADAAALRAALDEEYLHLIAPRQMGKTSLLRRLAAQLRSRGWRCAYVDLSTLMDLSKVEWYTGLGSALAEGLTPGPSPNLRNQVDLRRYLLDEALGGEREGRRVALLLDEVEAVSNAREAGGTAFADSFFMTLRSLYNQRHERPGSLVVALAGTADPGGLVGDPDISPFNVGREIPLEDFAAPATWALAGALALDGSSLEGDVLQGIHAWTGGHPYLTQALCAGLDPVARARCPPGINAADVDEMVERTFIHPPNPLQRDKNLRHVARALQGLSGRTAALWSRLQQEGSLNARQVDDALYLELYLTGAVVARQGHLVIRNRIYAAALAPRPDIPPPARGARTPATGPIGPRSGVVRVFISSTWLDLRPEREAVAKALQRLPDILVIGLEHFGSRTETPHAASLDEVDGSDCYVGIIGHRYGSGITEAEYRRARSCGLPSLIYFKDPDVLVNPSHVERDGAAIAALERFKRELQDVHVVSAFASPDRLAAQVLADLQGFIQLEQKCRASDSSRSPGSNCTLAPPFRRPPCPRRETVHERDAAPQRLPLLPGAAAGGD